MKIGRKIRDLSASKIRRIMLDYQKYTDFNRLGLFRGILESEKLSLEEKKELRDAAIAGFPKYFDFLVIKDPETWDQLQHLGEERLRSEIRRDWEEVRRLQQRLLKEKKLQHRNFGIYSKHLCGHDLCGYNGSMVRAKHSPRYGYEMFFDTDNRRDGYHLKQKEYCRKKAKRARQWLADWEEERQQ
jgi:hypothetical protein